MIAQYLTWDDEVDESYGITYEIKGTKEQEEYAEWLWEVTQALSDAVYHYGKVEDNLAEDGYEDEEIERILEAYPNRVSSDPFTAYDECVSKLKELGMEVIELDDCDEPDVWTSTGVY